MTKEIFPVALVLNLLVSPLGFLSCIACGFMSADRLKKPSKMTKVNPVIWCNMGLVIFSIGELLMYVVNQLVGHGVSTHFDVLMFLYWAVVVILTLVYPGIIGGAVIVTIVAVVHYVIAKKKDCEKTEWWKKYVSGCFIWDAGLLLPGIVVNYLMYLFAMSFS